VLLSLWTCLYTSASLFFPGKNALKCSRDFENVESCNFLCGMPAWYGMRSNPRMQRHITKFPTNEIVSRKMFSLFEFHENRIFVLGNL
jgi:hypothetical protein